MSREFDIFRINEIPILVLEDDCPFQRAVFFTFHVKFQGST